MILIFALALGEADGGGDDERDARGGQAGGDAAEPIVGVDEDLGGARAGEGHHHETGVLEEHAAEKTAGDALLGDADGEGHLRGSGAGHALAQRQKLVEHRRGHPTLTLRR